MKTVELGNLWYFIAIAILAILTLAIILFLKNKSERFRFWFLFSLLLSAFFLHFLKLTFEPYSSSLPFTYSKSTFENTCAVSTLLFPWIFLSKHKLWRDYMVIVGIISGFFAILIPTGALGQPLYALDCLRFYYAHYIIFLVPLLMGWYRIHPLSVKRILWAPVLYLFVLGLVLVNEIVIIGIGLVDRNFDLFFDPDLRNTSFIFGIGKNFGPLKPIFDFMVPKFLRTHPITGEEFYWPLLWIVIPAFLIITGFGILFCLAFNYSDSVSEIKSLFRECKKKILRTK